MLKLVLMNINREYIKITYQYPIAAAKAFSGLSDPFKFVYVSGEKISPIPTYSHVHH